MNSFDRKPNFTAKKYARIIERFSQKENLSLDDALRFFYHSSLYPLVSKGVSDLHCMSDEYLVEELELEYHEKNKK